MKKEIVHHSRFLFATESACGLDLTNDDGTTLHSNTIIHSDVTCKNCLRKLKKAAKG